MKEGKRHANTVKVKLIRPEDTFQKKKHRMSAKSFIDNVKEICAILDPKAAMLLSNDDKA